MSEDTKEFIVNWEFKLSQIQGETLNDVYDRFTSLYTIYNRLYNEAFRFLKEKKRLTKKNYSDFDKATIIVVEFISSKAIIESIKNNKNLGEIDAVCKLIENKVFYINLNNGQPREEIDEQLLNNLKSTDIEIKAKAITSLIYKIRCNMVHGYKDFQEYQRLIVEPVSILLKDIIEAFKTELNKEI